MATLLPIVPLDVAEHSPLSVRRVVKITLTRVAQLAPVGFPTRRVVAVAPRTDIRRKRLNLRYTRSQKSKLQLLQFAAPVANASGVS